MINFSYTTPKEADKGTHENETVTSSSTHLFKDTTPHVINDEISKLMARYPDYDFDIKLTFKTKKHKAEKK